MYNMQLVMLNRIEIFQHLLVDSITAKSHNVNNLMQTEQQAAKS